MEKKFTEKQEELETAKREQGWLRSTFRDSQKVDHLEEQIQILQKEIIQLEKNIYKLRKKIRTKM
jgi:predicted  nucleic acid-binding Zn-ribbon protein